MAEKAGIFLITKEALEKHEAELESKMASIKARASERSNLTNLLKDLRIDKEWTEAEDALRRGFCLYYEMYDTLQERAAGEKIDGNIPESEKRTFFGAYSAFAASSFIEYRLNRNLKGEAMEYPKSSDFSFDFSKTQNDVLNEFLALFYLMTEHRREHEAVKTGQDLINSSINFFRFMKEHAISKKPLLNKKLVELVSNAGFRIMDEFTISGFEARLEEKVKEKVEFVKVVPKEVVGNRAAKRKVIRYMDRLTLYDQKAKNNPCLILGGLSWTNLWDGIPGTGKTTMIRMAMTRLAEVCDIIGMKYKIHAIDQSVKSEFYGKTGQNAIAEFNSTRDPNFLHITIMDDLDLLTQGSRQESTGGADNDLRNVIMQFLDGAFTLRIGNNQVYAASNDPKGLDSAIRNRFSDRILVKGPETVEDLSDMTMILTKSLRDAKLFLVEAGYEPFKTQDDYVNGKWTMPDEVVYAIDPEIAKRFKKATIKEFGQYLLDLKQKNPSISGRSVRAIMDAVKERSANFDVPTEFFTDRKSYIEQPFQRKVDILRELYKRIEPEVLFQEAKRYAESEERYTKGEEDREVERGYNARMWGMKAELKAMKAHQELYGEVDALRNQIVLLARQRRGIIDRVKSRGKG